MAGRGWPVEGRGVVQILAKQCEHPTALPMQESMVCMLQSAAHPLSWPCMTWLASCCNPRNLYSSMARVSASSSRRMCELTSKQAGVEVASHAALAEHVQIDFCAT
jgi:hypothetical protein